MRFIAITAAVLASAVTMPAAAATCTWSNNDGPTPIAYKGMRGNVVSVSSTITSDRDLGRGRKFTYHVRYPNGTVRSSWTLMSTDTPRNAIVIGDTHIWRFNSNLTGHYRENRYVPTILHRKTNGICEPIGLDFSTNAAGTGI